MRDPKTVETLMTNFFASGKPWSECPKLTPEEFQTYITTPEARAKGLKPKIEPLEILCNATFSV